jgi:pilus assembly protein CpaC
MTKSLKFRSVLATATVLAIGLPLALSTAPSAFAQTSTERADRTIELSMGTSQIVNLNENISDVFVSNNKVADVEVRSPRQIHVVAKEQGTSTFFAITKSGRIAYSANISVGQGINSLNSVIKSAFPDADVKANINDRLVILTGTVKSPEDANEIDRMVNGFVGNKPSDTEVKTMVINRLRTATPLQVSLHVKIAEVNREVSKKIGFNILNQGNFVGSGILFSQGRTPGTIKTGTRARPEIPASPGGVTPAIPAVQGTGSEFKATAPGAGSSIALAGRFLGLDLLASLDLAETDGLVTTLAEPNLTALSGETASFLAGGEIPIPFSDGNGGVTINYKEYGVGLAFTPTVLSDGRISMRVRPEVSELNDSAGVRYDGLSVPGISTRRAETTVELGSGQSFMIGGLMRNSHQNSVEKTPFLGDLPILGNLFRSRNFRRNQSELVIVVTPYLVKPVSADQITLPTDKYRSTDDVDRLISSKVYGEGGETSAPLATPGAPTTVRTDGKGRPIENSARPGFGE